DEPDFEGEELVTERVVEPAVTAPAFATPRSGHLRPLPENGNGTGNGLTHVVNRLMASTNQEDKIRFAQLKGYEGEPCAECGQLTLVRSGACLKCDTCGASSGCS